MKVTALFRVSFKKIEQWLSASASISDDKNRTHSYALNRAQLIASCAAILILAFGVRLLYWQDINSDSQMRKPVIGGLVKNYQREAERIVNEGRLLLPAETVNPGDARMIVHPPGYAILMAILDGENISDTSFENIRLAQILSDAASAIFIFLIAAELLPFAVAILSSLFVALSPHIAYYSLWLSPDAIAVLPILVAVYLIIQANRKPRLITIIAAGAMIGLTCWMRSNALMLAPFLAIVIFIIFKNGKRLRYSIAFICVAIIVISPIMMRNWIIYERFIPLSIGAGITMIEGIADYDTKNRFDLPQMDKEVAFKDAEWHNRPEYAGNLWTPDGVERDRYRFARGIDVARSDPLWFTGVMLRRAAFMLRYNDQGESRWPLGTAKVPTVSVEPPFGHPDVTTNTLQPDWSASPEELLEGAVSGSGESKLALSDDGGSLKITGDRSEYGDQFISAPIQVEPNTDYVCALSLAPARGNLAVKITSADRRISLVSLPLQESSAKKPSNKANKAPDEDVDNSEPDDDYSASVIRLPFASGDRVEVRLVLSNNGASSQTLAQVFRAEIFKAGPTPYQWTVYPRAIVRGLQKNIYKTALMLSLVFTGILLIGMTGRWQTIVMLIAVPLYYLIFQSALHTEYRYILAIHYFLFILAAVTIYCAVFAMMETFRWLKSRVTGIKAVE